MPRCSHFIICFCLLFQSGVSMAQAVSIAGRDITGLWKGVMHNDTTGRDLRYEIAISEYKGKLSGFSHTFFILDDREYFGVKKVKVRARDDRIIIEDQELIAHNYPIPPAKGVRQLNVLTLEIQDSIMILTGPFSTNRTKDYRSLTGNIRVQRKNNFRQSALVPHLEELGLANELSFVEKEKPVEIKTLEKAEPVIQSLPVVTTKPVIKREPILVKNEPVNTKVSIVTGPAADVSKRKIETIQSVFYKTDSLVLTLYDNGEVDGDTVSVLMNGKVIMPMVGLSTKAVRKTIYITPDTPDSIQLIMYAENLGSIPPNTGLLVVHDGEDIYEIRFSGDLERNAAIIFRKKKGPPQTPPKEGLRRP